MQKYFSIHFIFVFILCIFFEAPLEAKELESNAVIYGVVPAFFGKKPLQSVTERLEHLSELGVDILWISPLQESDDSGVINYSVTDYFKLRADFGTDEDLKELVEKAHQHGMKVIIDFVPNHTSMMHPFFQDALNKGNSSDYFGFYERDSEGNHTYYFDWDYLPNLNYSNPKVIEMMEQALTHWIKKYSIDGFRLDVAWGLRERAPEVWPRYISRLKEINPELIFLAEAPSHDSYYAENGFHWGYDWGEELGQWAWKDVFEQAKGLSGRLDRAVSASLSSGRHNVRFLNNNDTGKRFITRYGIKTLKVASVLQHTLPGAALLYTGDEVGAEYEPYEDPPPVVWEDPHELTPFYKNLIKVRKTLSALSSDEFTAVSTPPEGAVYSYFRGKGEDRVLVVLNFGKKSEIEIDGVSIEVSVLKDELTQEEVPVQRLQDKNIKIELPAKSAFVFKLGL